MGSYPSGMAIRLDAGGLAACGGTATTTGIFFDQTFTLPQGTPATSILTISFLQGWNLLGNSQDQPIDVKTVFGDATTPTALSSQTTTVWAWDAAHTQWAFFSPSMTAAALASYAQSKSYLVLQTLQPKQGFWINAKSAGSLPALAGNPATVAATDLVTGWNLVSDGQNIFPPAFNSRLVAASANLVTLWAWDAANSKWFFYSPSLDAQGGTALASYITAKGYLDFTASNRKLSPGTGFWVNRQ